MVKEQGRQEKIGGCKKKKEQVDYIKMISIGNRMEDQSEESDHSFQETFKYKSKWWENMTLYRKTWKTKY